MEHKLLWIDYVMFLGLPSLFTIALLTAAFVSGPWTVPAIGISLAVIGMSWAIGILRMYSIKLSNPVFIALGCDFYLRGTFIPPVYISQCERALKHFAKYVAESELVDSEEPMLKIFKKGACVFYDAPIDYNGKKYNGLASGYSVHVNWMGGFKINAFFHEWGHILQEEVLKRDRDYKHEDAQVWPLMRKIKREWKTQE